MTESVAKETYVRTFNRFEFKYLLHYSQAKALIDSMSGYVRSDANAGPDGYYKIVSRYYDSRDLKCYWEKVDGEKFRRKLRIRTYGEDITNAFVEIKQRNNLSVQKRRCRFPLTFIEEQVKLMQAGRYLPGADRVLDEACNLMWQYCLEPKLVISYNRAAFFDTYRKDLRITFDRNIKCRNLSLGLDRDRLGGVHVIPQTMYVLEVKFNEAIPRWLCASLNHLDLQLQRISKYCEGIERMGLQNRS